ncbi:MAG: uroporphyrinogen decarboxylase [Actinobacteria bacterium]|nr:uroporphyrinogen decarboxylase [Actinomycetota bacterium]
MKKLTHRERVVRALNYQEPDRVPLDLGGPISSMMENAYWNLKKYLGMSDDSGTKVSSWGVIKYYDERVLEYLDIDIRHIFPNESERNGLVYNADGSWTDEFGIVWRRTPNPFGYYSEMIAHPLEDFDIYDLEKFDWPDPDDPSLYSGIRERVEDIFHNTDYAVAATAVAGGLFETAQWLRGMDQFLIDIKTDKNFALKLLEKICEFEEAIWSNFLNIVGPFISIVERTDDFGMQTGLMISLETYREIIKPFHKRVLDLIKSKTKAKILHHSCGSIVDLIDDLIDIGVDIINPIQPFAHGMEDPLDLKKRFGDRVIFHGGIDQQNVLPRGTPVDVEEEVKKRIKGFAPGGGYILAAAHNIQDDTPPQNVIAMLETAKSYGKYPITIE